MAAAFGLYTHIQSNRRRSIALLLGLFFLVYVMVYAGALIAGPTGFTQKEFFDLGTERATVGQAPQVKF